MKKTLLYVTICAGAVACTSAVILSLMCGGEVLTAVRGRIESLKLSGKKANACIARIIGR